MYHFIINPKSQSGNSAFVWHRIKKILIERNIDFEVHATKRANQATELARALTENGEEKTLIVIGGDGFLNEVINGICFPEKMTLGYIPSGSGNDFARSLNIPKNSEKALDIILNSHETIDCNIGYTIFGENKRKFIVSSGIGFDAAVCYGVDKSRLKPILNKVKLGKLVYMMVALKEVFFRPTHVLTATFDNGETKEFTKCLFAVSMNLPYEGGGYKFCPNAICNDGYLDVMIVNNVSPFNFLYMMPFAFSGKHIRFNTIHQFRCKQATYTLEDSAHMHTDGEAINGQNKITTGLEEQTIRIITGGNTNEDRIQ